LFDVKKKGKEKRKRLVGFDLADYGSIEGRGRKYVHGSESAINYIPDDPDVETELALLGRGKTL